MTAACTSGPGGAGSWQAQVPNGRHTSAPQPGPGPGPRSTHLCSSVAAHVHSETMTLAIRPVLTERPAVLNCSEVCLVPPYL